MICTKLALVLNMAARATSSSAWLPGYQETSDSYSATRSTGSYLRAQTTDDSIDILLSEINALLQQRPGGEHSPSDAAINSAKGLIDLARVHLRFCPPVGELDFYDDELGVEWRKETRILRLTCFGSPDAAPRVDFGTMSTTTPGEYRSDIAVTPELLAERLDWLSNPDQVHRDTSGDI